MLDSLNKTFVNTYNKVIDVGTQFLTKLRCFQDLYPNKENAKYDRINKTTNKTTINKTEEQGAFFKHCTK